MFMKKLYILLLAIAPGTLAFPQDKTDQPYLQRSFSNVQIQTAVVQTEGGFVSVNGTDSKDARVDVEIKCNGPTMSKAEIEQDLRDNYTFTVGIDNGRLSALLIRKSDDIPSDKRLYASFTLLIPRNTGTDISTAGSYIRLTGLNGKHQLVTSGGDIIVTSVNGDVNCTTSGGAIILNNVKQKIQLANVGGKIVMNHCSGDIDIANSGGRIVFSNVDGKIKVGNSGADIIGSNIHGSLEASNASGNVALFDISCKVSATTNNGNVYAKILDLEDSRLIVTKGKLQIIIPKKSNGDLALDADKIDAQNLDNFKGVKENGRLVGKVNNGGAKLTGSSVNGEIDIQSL
jgi:soluble P-type ATPase